MRARSPRSTASHSTAPTPPPTRRVDVRELGTILQRIANYSEDANDDWMTDYARLAYHRLDILERRFGKR